MPLIERLARRLPSAAVDDEIRHARYADAVAFTLLGGVFATWAVRIPAIRSNLGLSEGDIGLALLGLAVGSIVGLASGGVMVSRYGVRTVVRGAICVYTLSLPAITVAGGLTSLLAALVVFGSGKGLLDVAANTQGLRIERAYPRPIMGSFHALYSGGALLGAGAGAVATGLGLSVRTHFLLAAGTLLAVGLLASGWLLPVSDPDAGPSFSLPSKRILGFCTIGFCALFIEGIANDWSAVFLEDGAGASEAVAALGFAAFSFTMTFGRFLSDRIVGTVDPHRFLRWAAAVAAAGVGLTLVARPLASLAGFALLGLGLAGIAPVNVSLAGGADTEAPTESVIAAISTTGYGGFAIGPVAIGLLAEATSLRVAFLPALGFAVLVVAVTFTLPEPSPTGGQ